MKRSEAQRRTRLTVKGDLVEVASGLSRKLGRVRTPTPHRLLQFETIKRVRGINPVVETFDHSIGMPDDLGMLHNDTEGCCTASAKAHRIQVIRHALGLSPFAISDLADCTQRLYIGSTGFDPSQTGPDGSNPTDNGCNMDDLGRYLMRTGMPLPDGTIDRFVACFEIDVRNLADLTTCGRASIGVDFGIVVDAGVMPDDGAAPPLVWIPKGPDEGGHDTYGVGYLPSGNWKVNSWGTWYEWTPAFHLQNVETAIGYVSADALRDGKTVFGMDMATWQNAMAQHGQAVRAA